MIPELGHFALILALGLAIALFVLPALGVFKRDELLINSAGSLAAGMFVFLLVSFICLVQYQQARA